MRFQYCLHSPSFFFCKFVPVKDKLVGVWVAPYQRKNFLFHRGCSCDVSTILKSELIAGGRNRKDRPFPKYTIKVGKYSGRRQLDQFNPRAQDTGLRFWQTRSHAIVVFSSLLADCISKVISHKRERTQFERLSTKEKCSSVSSTGAATDSIGRRIPG